MKHFAYKTDADAEAGKITNSGNNDHTIEINENHQKKFKRRFPSFTRNLFEYSVEYSSYSTIQGLRYMGEKSRPAFERLTWLIFFCISLYFCITLVAKTYTKWNNSPVLVSFATKSTPIWKIPFPAITFCSDAKTRQNDYSFTQNYERMTDDPRNMTDTEMKQLNDVGLVCDPAWYSDGNETTGYDSIDFLKEIAPSFVDMMFECEYRLTEYGSECEDLFTPILTEEGVCYTYNMLNGSEIYRDNVFQYGDFMSHDQKSAGWTLQGGYPPNSPIDTYPRRTVSAGIQARLRLELINLVQDMDYMCKGPVQGFKIILHHPAEVPRFGLHFIRVPQWQEMTIAIKPDMITTSEDLRSYDPHTRQCYFPEERHLAFYRTYTQQNCEMECLTNFTRDICECVGFHMPQRLPRREVKSIINKGKSEAGVEESDDDIKESHKDRGLFYNLFNVKASYDDFGDDCDCLPGCTSLVYNAETFQADLNKDAYQLTSESNTEYGDFQVSRILMLFKEQQFISSERTELYSTTEFFSNCGGILGLFTGFSFLSLVEILYFLSLRILGNIKRYGKHYWSGSQELVTNERYDHKE